MSLSFGNGISGQNFDVKSRGWILIIHSDLKKNGKFNFTIPIASFECWIQNFPWAFSFVWCTVACKLYFLRVTFTALRSSNLSTNPNHPVHELRLILIYWFTSASILINPVQPRVTEHSIVLSSHNKATKTGRSLKMQSCTTSTTGVTLKCGR